MLTELKLNKGSLPQVWNQVEVQVELQVRDREESLVSEDYKHAYETHQ